MISVKPGWDFTAMSFWKLKTVFTQGSLQIMVHCRFDAALYEWMIIQKETADSVIIMAVFMKNLIRS